MSHTSPAKKPRSFNQLAQGIFPTTRHDLEPLDAARAALAGQAMPVKGACVEIRADWLQYAQTFGMSTASWGPEHGRTLQNRPPPATINRRETSLFPRGAGGVINPKWGL